MISLGCGRITTLVELPDRRLIKSEICTPETDIIRLKWIKVFK